MHFYAFVKRRERRENTQAKKLASTERGFLV